MPVLSAPERKNHVAAPACTICSKEATNEQLLVTGGGHRNVDALDAAHPVPATTPPRTVDGPTNAAAREKAVPAWRGVRTPVDELWHHGASCSSNATDVTRAQKRPGKLLIVLTDQEKAALIFKNAQ